MKVHARTEHMGVYDENFLTIWTRDFNCLTHGLPLCDFEFAISDSGNPLLHPPPQAGEDEAGVHHAQ
jgi:hypothetical protein